MISVLSAREAAVARRVWRDQWLATLDDLEACALDRDELYARLVASQIGQGRDQADRWWTT